MKPRTTVISFRCPLEVAREIDEARRPLNLSRSDWTRTVVQTNLLNRDEQLLIDRFDELTAQLAELRDEAHRNLSNATYVLLTRSAIAKQEAKELVGRLLKNGGRPE